VAHDRVVGMVGVFMDGNEVFGIARIDRATPHRLYVAGAAPLRRAGSPYWSGRGRGHDNGGAWATPESLAFVFDGEDEARAFAEAVAALARERARTFRENWAASQDLESGIRRRHRLRMDDARRAYEREVAAIAEEMEREVSEAVGPLLAADRADQRGFEGRVRALAGRDRVVLEAPALVLPGPVGQRRGLQDDPVAPGDRADQ